MMAICSRAILLINAVKCVVIDGFYMNIFLKIKMGCLK